MYIYYVIMILQEKGKNTKKNKTKATKGTLHLLDTNRDISFSNLRKTLHNTLIRIKHEEFD